MPTHIQAQAFSRLPQLVDIALVCYLCLCSQRYIVAHIVTRFLSMQPFRCCVWHFLDLPYQSTLWVMAAVPSCFCAIAATCVLASSKLRGGIFRACPHAIKSCLPRVYPWRHARDKVYQALSLLSGESVGTRLCFMRILFIWVAVRFCLCWHSAGLLRYCWIVAILLSVPIPHNPGGQYDYWWCICGNQVAAEQL